MINQDKQFEHRLEVFRTEEQSGTQFFYAFLAIKAIISDNTKIRKAVNETPMFWATNLAALQTAFFITLGRIFDQKSKYNINSLLRFAQENKTIFSKDALAERKRKDSLNADEWLEDYLKRSYEPMADDFRRLKGYVGKYRKIYMANYQKIRHKLYAHKEWSDVVSIKKQFRKTRIRELERLFIFLNQLYEALWELFHNGRKPVLRPMRYSINMIRKRRKPALDESTIQEQMVNDVKDFFNLLLRKK
jgi:hypothetical protein